MSTGQSITEVTHRFVYRSYRDGDADCLWVKRALMRPGDVDCTDMSDDELAQVGKKVSP